MVIESSNTIGAFQEALAKLKQLPAPLDDELVAEAPMFLTFTNLSNDTTVPGYDGKVFTPNFDYHSLGITDDIIDLEFNHYTNLFGKKAPSIISYLKEFPLSKRAIIDFWSEGQRDLGKPAQCLIYLLFRKTTQGLQMFAHLRANTANDKALLNFHTFAAFHHYVAKQVGPNPAEYYHFADSYHLKK